MKAVVNTRWVRSRKRIGGRKCVKTRVVERAYEGLDLSEGLVDTSGRVSLRSFHRRSIFSSAIKKWKISVLDFEGASSQSAGFGRYLCLPGPIEWDSSSDHRTWKFNAPSFGLRNCLFRLIGLWEGIC